MPRDYQDSIKRLGHGAATLAVNSDCVELILFGGYGKDYSHMADTTILKFGEN